jgi:hypothetical protein
MLNSFEGSGEFLRLQLETANMRVLQLRFMSVAAVVCLCGFGLVMSSPS